MRLTDVDELLEQIKRFRYYFGRPPRPEEIVYGIENSPIVDAVPVVRCKDCKYSCICYSDDGEDLYDCCKDVISGAANTCTSRAPDWFCADGKRYDE